MLFAAAVRQDFLRENIEKNKNKRPARMTTDKRNKSTEKTMNRNSERGKTMKKKISVVILGVVMMMSLCACSKECGAGCGEKASPDCSAGMCDSCCSWYAGLNGCRHTEFN